MEVDLEKVENAKGYLYVNDKRCPEPICVDDYIAYKEIEKELGIDLITLFKAMKDGVWYKTDGLHHTERTYKGIRLCGFGWCFEFRVDYKLKLFRFKDYGKTWSLTKEELL